MELNHLRYFYEVARLGSFTQASKELHVSQPSISRIVSLLESRVGYRLLDRAKRGTSLTEHGQVLYARCASIFREVDNFKTDIESWKKGVRGELKIALSDNLCHNALPNVLEKYWDDYPEVKIHVFTGSSAAIQDEILGGRAEIGIFYTQPRSRELESETLGAVEFAIVCSPKNQRLASGRFDAKKIEASWFIGCRAHDYRSAYPTLELLSKSGVRPQLFLEANSQEFQKRMAMRKIGYAVLPLFMVEEEIERGKLVRIPSKHDFKIPLRLVRKRGRTLSRPAQVFLERFRHEFHWLGPKNSCK